jgi:hypothetical protein
MAAPAITGQVLSDYAITTEEYTTAECVVANTPTDVLVVVSDGRLSSSYIMFQYSGTTYRREIWGHELGMVESATVRFIAVNADGGDIESAPSTISVTRPSYPMFDVDAVIDRLVYLAKHPEEYGGDNTLASYNVVKDFSGQLFSGSSLVKPVLFIHSIRETVDTRAIDQSIDVIKATIQFTVIRMLSDTTGTAGFYDANRAIRFLIRNNPRLQISGNSFLANHSKVANTRYPEWDKGYFSNEMNIDVEFQIDTRS